jgi:hypothetical protein
MQILLTFNLTLKQCSLNKNTRNLDIVIEYDNRRISNISYTKFMGITLDNTLYWKPHIDQLPPKLSLAYYAIRVIKQTTAQETLVIVYYVYFYSIMN